MKKLNSKEIKYLGEGIVGVYEKGKLTERFQLEKGDNLLEGLKGLMEASKRKVSSLGYQFDEEEIGDFGGGRSLSVTSEGGNQYIPEYVNITVNSYNKVNYGVSILVSSMNKDFYTAYDNLIDDVEGLKDLPDPPDLEKLISIAKSNSSEYYIIEK